MMSSAAQLTRGEIGLSDYPYLGVKHFALYVYFIKSFQWFGETARPLGWLTVAYTCLLLIAAYRLASLSGAGPVFALAGPLFLVVNTKLVTWDIWWKAAGLHFVPAAFWALLSLQLFFWALEPRPRGKRRVAYVLLGALCWMAALFHNVQAVFVAALPFAWALALSRCRPRGWRTFLRYSSLWAGLLIMFATYYFATESIFPEQAGYRNPYQAKSVEEFGKTLEKFYEQGYGLAAQWIASLGCAALAVIALIRRRTLYRWLLLVCAVGCLAAHELSAGFVLKQIGFAWPESVTVGGIAWTMPFALLLVLWFVALLAIPVQPMRRSLLFCAVLLALPPLQVASLFFNRDSMWERYNLYTIILYGVCVGGGFNALVDALGLTFRRVALRLRRPTIRRFMVATSIPLLVTILAIWQGAPMLKTVREALSYYSSFAATMDRRTQVPYQVASEIADWGGDRADRFGAATVILSSLDYWTQPRPNRDLRFTLRHLLDMRGLHGRVFLAEMDSVVSEVTAVNKGVLLAIDDLEKAALREYIGEKPMWSINSEFAKLSLFETREDIDFQGALMITTSNYRSFDVSFPHDQVRSGTFRMFAAGDVLEIPFSKVQPNQYSMKILLRGFPSGNETIVLSVTDFEGRSVFRDTTLPARTVELQYPIVISSPEGGIRLRMETSSSSRQPTPKVMIASVSFVPLQPNADRATFQSPTTVERRFAPRAAERGASEAVTSEKSQTLRGAPDYVLLNVARNIHEVRKIELELSAAPTTSVDVSASILRRGKRPIVVGRGTFRIEEASRYSLELHELGLRFRQATLQTKVTLSDAEAGLTQVHIGEIVLKSE